MNCTDPDSVNRAVDAGADVLLLMNDQQQAAAEKIDEQSAKEELHEVALADHHVDDAKGPSSLGGLNEALTKALFLLTAHRQEGQPGRYFQAAAILDVLQHCEALALVHQDKHGPCFGFYSPEPVLLVPQLEALAVQRELLAVPFAIPPMLARWDRAIWELRQDWDEGAKGPFPVPISEISRVRIERQEEREAKELAKIQLKAAEE